MPDPYLYPNSRVLVNKFDIHDAERLSEVENDLVYIKLFEVDEFISGLTYDTNGLQALHKYLFEDVYAWAGQLRTVNIFKYERVLTGTSVGYGEHSRLQEELDAAFSDMRQIQWKKLAKQERAATFARAFARIWRIHPFREGNTRTITTFMIGYAHHAGMTLDGALLSKYNAYVRESLVLASIGDYSEYEHLEKIILDAMGYADMPKEAVSDTKEAYSHIKDHEIKDYYYRQFETDK